MAIVRPLQRRALVPSALCALVLVVAACTEEATPAPDPVIIGVGSTTEQRVLAALTLTALGRAAVVTEVRTDLGGTTALRGDAQQGRIELFWDYTGAAWALGLDNQRPVNDPEESWERVHEADKANGLTWLPPTTANATLALFVRPTALPPEGEPRGLSWLATVLSEGGRALCADPDFIERPGGWAQLAGAYAINRGVVPLEHADEDEAIRKVAADDCFAGLATATSGAAQAEGLVEVTDDLRVFPAFVVAPVARTAALGAHPELADALAGLVALLDNGALAALNAQAEGASPEELQQLADQFLGPLPSPS